MSTKHTPGPWTYEGEHIYSDGGGHHVAVVEPANMSRFADAALIAAAPDLLAACQRTLRAYKENWRVEKMDFPPWKDLEFAIAKATKSTEPRL